MSFLKYVNKPLLAVFCLCLCVFCGYYFFAGNDGAGDADVPVLTIAGGNPDAGEEPWLISSSVGEEALLSGVTAQDGKDGDLTASVVLESVSAFDADNVRTVTYAVCDSDGNVTKGKRRIAYTDYTGPKFSLSEGLRYTTMNLSDAVSAVGAVDVLDGDLSEHIRIDNYVLGATDLGACEMTLSVANSAQTTSRVTIYIPVVSSLSSVPYVTLSDYIVYAARGVAFSPKDLILSVSSAIPGETLSPADVTVHTDLDMETAGQYIVSYTVKNSAGVTGTTYLTVVVE